jgi:hypothetical protein
MPALPPTASRPINFHKDILPILANRCVTCHASGRSEGSFSLETRTTLLAESDSGKVVLPGDSENSILIHLVSSTDTDVVMPKQGKRLTQEEIGLLRAWIDQGAAWDGDVSLRKLTMRTWQPREVKLPTTPAANASPIDSLLTAYFGANQNSLPTPVEDRTFARRVYFDLGGLPPTPQEMQTFLENPSPHKRAELVRQLLADQDRYAQHWLTFWNDLLRNDYAGTGFIDGGRKQITPWLYESLRVNKPLGTFVGELLTQHPGAEGFIKGFVWRGNVNASQRPPMQAAQNVSQVFLGINLKCASCHDSFVSQWKLKDAYSLAAVYADEPLEIWHCDKNTEELAQPQFLNTELGEITTDMNRTQRQAKVASLFTAPENARLRRTIVNRLWARFFGRGLIEPVDELDNPAWSDDLLDFLANDLQAHGGDLKRTMEVMLTSQAYQLPSRDPSSVAAKFVFQGPLVKRLTAEEFVDTLWQVTGLGPEKADARLFTSPGPLAAFASWIWRTGEASGNKIPAGEKLTLRYRFQLDAVPTQAHAVANADNAYMLLVNGQQIIEDDNNKTVEAFDLAPALRQGENEILALVTNAGKEPNPAGFFFAALLEDAQGKVSRIITSPAWEWRFGHDMNEASAQQTPDNADENVSEEHAKKDAHWRSAVPLAKQDFLGRASQDELATALAKIDPPAANAGPSVRSALVKSTYLMRTLGRPNREQVVTTRPDLLTTLEALDLTNGPEFSELLTRGGETLNATHPNWTTEQATQFFFEQFTSRAATPLEVSQASEWLGEKPTAEGLADLMWSVLLLPDCQLVR